MRELRFETGIEEFEVNGGGVLRFNPTDPGLYARFAAFCEELPGIVAGLGGKDGADGAGSDSGSGSGSGAGSGSAAFLAAMEEADRVVKERLSGVFGPGNDVGALFAGVNLLGLCAGGATALENLMDALAPIIEENAAAREAELKRRAKDARQKADGQRKARGA